MTGLAGAYSQAAADARLTGEDAAFATVIVDEAAVRAERRTRELDHSPGPTRKPARGPVRSQPRNKDSGLAGHPGRFAPKTNTPPTGRP